MEDTNQSSPTTALPKELFHSGNGTKPLKKFSIMVGSRRIRLKVVDVKDVDAEMGSTMSLQNNAPSISSPTKYSVPLPSSSTSSSRVLDDTYPIVCQYCDQSFLSTDDYWPHLQQQHKRYHKLFQCTICSKVFTRNISYRMHMRRHERDGNEKRNAIGDVILDKCAEIEQQQACVEDVEKQRLRFQCNYCEKKFLYRREFIIHERTHTKERPYICEFCGQSFIQSQALTIHVRTHTGERRYHCRFCTQAFKDGPALKKHEFLKHGQ